jgi:hypothetical protein
MKNFVLFKLFFLFSFDSLFFFLFLNLFLSNLWCLKLISVVKTDFSLHLPDIKPFQIPLDVNLYRHEFKGYYTMYYLFNYL